MSDDMGSPLSDLSSDDFEAEEEREQERMAAPASAPPARKRQKVSATEFKESATPPKYEEEDYDDGAISEDSFGDVPNSPGPQSRFDDDDLHEQVTVCIWDGCHAGDLLDMDKLVKHIHDNHIESKGKKYPCEWGDCTRKGLPHASAYALRAHMRSHTREKPFYCELPECDRAFTRSDALAKHYRTVHETEALRPSDPIPKSMQERKLHPKEDSKTPQPPKLGPGSNGPDRLNGAEWTSSYPAELGFTAEEEARGPQELYRLLRRQICWAEEESDSLRQQCDTLEEIHKKEWQEREFLIEQTVKVELVYQKNKRVVMASAQQSQDTKDATDKAWNAADSPLNESSSPSPMPLVAPPEETKEGAAILASLHAGP